MIAARLSDWSASVRQGVLLLPILAAFAALGGAAVAVLPVVGLAGVLAAAIGLGAVLSNRTEGALLSATAGLLMGYAFLGKGLAHVGVGPIFIGEVALALAAATTTGLIVRSRIGPFHFLIVAFAAWGAFATLPYVKEYGIDALRDAVTWAYAAFALALALAVKAHHFPKIASLYGRLIVPFLCWVPLAAILYNLYSQSLPPFPGSSVPFMVFKGGDVAVHLAAVAAFLLLGLHERFDQGRLRALPVLLVWPLWLMGTLMAGSVNRGGLVAITLTVAAVLVLKPSTRGLRWLCTAALVASALMLFNVEVDLGRTRNVSIEQLTRNVVSVVSPGAAPELRGTTEWRTEWWREIVDYTLRGPYFWTGKGFGVNLAAEDGFQVTADGSLRSPHSAHLTILARMGVPGFAFWVALQAGFAVALLMAFFRAQRRGDEFWARMNVWILAYWLAMMVNMAFDVYLEGPQGGIWFWSVFGLGLAALAAQKSATYSQQAYEIGVRPGARHATSARLTRQRYVRRRV
jgi:hypothetical protein